jgi:hypothetical protein
MRYSSKSGFDSRRLHQTSLQISHLSLAISEVFRAEAISEGGQPIFIESITLTLS